MKYLTLLIITIMAYSQHSYPANIREAVEYYDGIPCLVYIIAIETEKIIKPFDEDFIRVTIHPSYRGGEIINDNRSRVTSYYNKISKDTLYAYFTYQDIKDMEGLISIHVLSNYSYLLDIIERQCTHNDFSVKSNIEYFFDGFVGRGFNLLENLTPLDQDHTYNNLLKTDSKWLNQMRENEIIPVYNHSIFKHICEKDSTIFLFVKITNMEIFMAREMAMPDKINLEKDNKIIVAGLALKFDNSSVLSVFSINELELPDIVDIGFSTSIGAGKFRDVDLKSKIKKIK